MKSFHLKNKFVFYGTGKEENLKSVSNQTFYIIINFFNKELQNSTRPLQSDAFAKSCMYYTTLRSC